MAQSTKEYTAIRLYCVPQVPRFARGGLAKAAESVRRAGRHGDDVLIHVNKDELRQMRELWGPPQINPKTGIPEYGFLSKAWKKIKGVVKKIAPIASLALNFVPGLGTAASMALQAGLGAVSGGTKGALSGLVGGAMGSGIGGNIGKAVGLSGKTASTVGNALLGGLQGTVGGGDFKSGALQGGLSGLLMGDRNTAAGKAGETAGKIPGTNPINPTATIPAAGNMPAFDIQAPALAPIAKPGIMDTIKGLPGKAVGYAKEHPFQTAALGVALGSALGGHDSPEAAAPPAPPPGWNDPLPQYNYARTAKAMPNVDKYYTYGQAPEQEFFENNALAAPGKAAGGRSMSGGPSTQGPLSRYVKGGTAAPGRADNIDARLSENEYVVDAETVALLGDGNPDAGAKKLDQMREKIRSHKGKKLARGKISPNAKSALQYLG